MPDTFYKAFKRMPEELKNVKDYEQLRLNFGSWQNSKVVSKKQNRALAIEANRIGIKVPNMEEKYVTSKGNLKSRFRNIVTGYYVKTKDEHSLIPIWRTKDVSYNKGISYNAGTGESLRVRDAKGYFLKKSDWTLTDKSGNVKYLYQGDVSMVKKSDVVKQSERSKRRAQSQSKNREYTEKVKRGEK